MPNARRTVPEIRLTQARAWLVTRARSQATTLVRISHQRAEPTKTPAVSMAAWALPRPTRPAAAKIPAKDRIVIGLVIVGAKMDTKAATRPGRASAIAASAGWARMVRIASQVR